MVIKSCRVTSDCLCYNSFGWDILTQMHKGDFLCLVASRSFTHEGEFLCLSVSGQRHGCQAHKHIDLLLSKVTFVSLCVPNDSVDSITRRGTVGRPRKACLRFTWSHACAFIVETQRLDGRLLVFGCERHVAPPRKPKGPMSVSSGGSGSSPEARLQLFKPDRVSKP